jgi:hypothetical protein
VTNTSPTLPAAPRARTAEDLRKALQRVADNLFTLEVNTIIKDNIMGTNAPSTGHALIDIVQDYETKLRDLGEATGAQSTSLPVASWAKFDELRDRAGRMYDGKPAALAPGRSLLRPELLMLCRIRDNCDQIKSIFEEVKKRSPGGVLTFTRQQAPEVELLPEELMSIRKIWDIGTEEIVMQTVIQLGGDVVTRLHSAYTAERYQPLVRIHDGSVSISISTWNKLVETVGAFFEFAAHLALGR